MKKYIVLVSLLTLPVEIFSQNTFPFLKPNSDEVYSSIEKIQREQLEDLYIYRTGSSGEFINGREYFPYFVASQHKPLIRNGEYRTSSLVFNGRKIDNIALMYDTYKDKVIYTNDTLIFNNRFCQIDLNKNNIERFDLFFAMDTMTFMYLTKKADKTFNLDDGFYEVVYDNECRYIIKHRSTCSLSNGVFEYYYSPASYLKINGRYVKMTTKGQFLNLFGDKREEIKKYIQNKKIRYHKATSRQIAGIIKFYENL